VLAAAERHEYAVLPTKIDLACKDSDVGGRALEDRSELIWELVSVEAGGSIKKHQLDVIGRRQANDVPDRLERREDRSPRGDRE
jgi:hypothetical protein